MSDGFDEIRFYQDQHHMIHMETSPIYREAYNSPMDAKNPYPYPEALGLELIKLSSVKGPLTEAQKTELIRVRTEHDGTDWNQWSLGHYRLMIELWRREGKSPLYVDLSV